MYDISVEMIDRHHVVSEQAACDWWTRCKCAACLHSTRPQTHTHRSAADSFHHTLIDTTGGGGPTCAVCLPPQASSMQRVGAKHPPVIPIKTTAFASETGRRRGRRGRVVLNDLSWQDD